MSEQNSTIRFDRGDTITINKKLFRLCLFLLVFGSFAFGSGLTVSAIKSQLEDGYTCTKVLAK